MKDRFTKVREAAGLSQKVMAERLGLSRNYISLIECGARMPSDRTISDICRKFDVNETWLRTGEGEMQRKIGDSEKVMTWISEVLMDKPESFRRRLVEVLVELTPEQLDLMNDIADRLIEKKNKKKEEP